MDINKIKRMLGLNKYIIIFMVILFLFGVGGTYAYYFFRVEDGESVIAGNIISIDAELEVDLVVGSNAKMVPMKDDALSNALKGVGSTNGACIDRVGNLSCQVYRIRLINKGSKLRHLNGSIELYAKDGTGNVYNNLKWRELNDITTVKSNSNINSMTKSFLVEDLTIESKQTLTWYIAVWVSEIDDDQRELDKGLFGGTVTFEVVGDDSTGNNGSSGSDESVSSSFIEEVMATNAVSDKDIDFSVASSTSGTNGIFYIEDTKNDSNPIYYYRGAVDNNLIFAGFCWKIVRTTETGGLKLIYSGVPLDNKCDNADSSSRIGTISFNSSSNSPAYVGYMYGANYNYSTKWMSSVSSSYYYGNDVSYSNGTYTLTNTITSNSWSSIYNGGLNNNHYTCFTTGNTCTSVYYIYYTSSSTAYYITLTNGKKVEDALSEMLDNNTTSSTIKGNNTSAGSLDYWYYTNIEQKGYGSYIEDTVWCNDRSVGSLNGWDPNGGNTRAYLYFSSYNRMFDDAKPSVICNRKIDSFTVSNANGNGDLEYPVGLLTLDEVMLAGANAEATNKSYYLYTGNDYWVNSPYNYSTYYASGGYVYSTGDFEYYYVNYSYGVRPSISLSAGFTVNNGDGTTSSPYVVS